MEFSTQWTGQYEQRWKDLFLTRKTTGNQKVLHVSEVRSSNHRQEKKAIKKERQRSVSYRSVHVICFIRHWNESIVVFSSPKCACCRMQVIHISLPCQQLAAMDLNPEIQPQKALNWFDIAKYILYTLPLLDYICSTLLPSFFLLFVCLFFNLLFREIKLIDNWRFVGTMWHACHCVCFCFVFLLMQRKGTYQIWKVMSNEAFRCSREILE